MAAVGGLMNRPGVAGVITVARRPVFTIDNGNTGTSGAQSRRVATHRYDKWSELERGEVRLDPPPARRHGFVALTVFKTAGQVRWLGEGATIDGGEVLPEFAVPVADIFEGLAPKR